MNRNTIYDLAGVGIGPFNLGLAALSHPIADLSCIFLEQKSVFSWHEGMMIPGTTLQVPYLADLVTLVDPSSKFSYLNFLRAQNRLLQFGIYDSGYITRTEYNRYCMWVSSQLDNLLFSCHVKDIVYNEKDDFFEILVNKTGKEPTQVIYARHVVVGIGSSPHIPQNIRNSVDSNIIHSSAYTYHKEKITSSKKITVIGSGQSAAEILYDLISSVDLSITQLNWITRSDRFYAMEHSKLNYEMTSPDYIDFFYGLDPNIKIQLLRQQFSLYKGINHQLIDAIYNKLYELFIEGDKYNVMIRTHSELKSIEKYLTKEYSLQFYHSALKENYAVNADFVVLATGYESGMPGMLTPLKNLIQFDTNGTFLVNRNYSIDQRNRVFVQNMELHSHGFNAPDLGLGANRNAVILNNILKKQIYPVDQNTCFQKF